MVVVPLLFSKPFAKLNAKHGLSTKRAAVFLFLAWSTHVLIDVFTTYGTQVFAPFSDYRAAFNNFFIIDPLFTLPLLVCCGWIAVDLVRTLLRKVGDRELLPWRSHGALICLAISSVYVVFSFGMKAAATRKIVAQVQATNPDAQLVATSPTPLNTILWRGLMETEDAFLLHYWSPFDKEPGRIEWIPKQRELAEKFRGDEFFEGLVWFSRGDWLARPNDDGSVTFVDFRFGEMRNLRTKEMVPMFQWKLKKDGDGPLESKNNRPERPKVKKALALLWERIWGEQSRWESVEPF